MTIPNSVTSIGGSAFYNCNGFTGNLTIPDGVITIGNSAFMYCSGFTGVLTIPNSVTTIEDYAFQDCSGFTGALTIGNSVTTIGSSAFINCSGFTSIKCMKSAPPVPALGTNAFTGISIYIPVYVVCGMLPYFASSNWTIYFYNLQEAIPSISVQSNDETMGAAAVTQHNTCESNEAIITATANSGYFFIRWSDGNTDNPRTVEVTTDTTFTATFAQGWNIGYPNPADLTATISGTAPNYTLTIDGTGIMQNFDNITFAPWYDIRSNIKTLVINHGVTTIGNSAFAYFTGFTGTLTIPNSVTSIGDLSFTGCSGFTGALTIPNSVTSIGDLSFADCSGFTGALTIPNGVTSIGDQAFINCSGFTGALTIGNSVTTIGDYAFYHCYFLTGALTIPNSVTSIGNNAFEHCNYFTGVTIGNSVKTIGDYAFADCSGFTGDLTIPGSVTSIGNYAFNNCSGLTSITCKTSAPPVPALGDNPFVGINNNIHVYVVCGMLPYFESSDWATYVTNFQAVPPVVTVQSDDETMGSASITQMPSCGNLPAIIQAFPNSGYLFVKWNDDNTDNPRTVEVTSDTVFTAEFDLSISWNIGFPNPTDLTATISGTAPNYTLTIDGTGAMQDFALASDVPWYSIRSNITTLVINDGVTTIGNYAFLGCSGLTGALTIPNSVTAIGNYAFADCSNLTGALTIPNSVTTIGTNAFYYCSGFTGALTIPNSVITIGNNAFYHCTSFTGALTIGNGVTTIGDNAFQNCSGFTGDLTVPGSVTSIGGWAFQSCSGFTGALTIGNSVTTIGDYAFSYCAGLTGALTIGNSVTTIGSSAFTNCSGLTSVYIPNSVVSIAGQSFQGNSALTSITVVNADPANITLGGDVFYGVDKSACTLYVPIGSLVLYRTAAQWQDFFNINGISYIGYPNPEDVTAILSGSSPNYTLTVSGTGMMQDFASASDVPWYSIRSNIKTLVINEGVTTIGSGAFYDCSGFTGTLTIPNDVTRIGDSAFYGCNGFTGNLTIGNSVTTIGYAAFATCSGFTGALTIGNSVTTIGDYAFYNCSGLTGALTIPDGVTTIGNFAFYGCSDFTSVICKTPAPPVPAISSNTFAGISNSIPVYVVCGMQPYFESSDWATYFNNFQGIAPVVTVQSNDETMGSAAVVQQNTCENSEAIIAATVNSGYCFSQWSDGNTDNPRTVEVTTDITYTAEFTALPVITVLSNNAALGSASVVQQPASCENLQAIIQATANSGYCFSQWSDGNTANPRTVEVTTDITYTADFTALPVVTVQSNNDLYGSASITQMNTCENNEAVIQATANSSYFFIRWSDGNTNNPRTVEVTSDTVLIAEFSSSALWEIGYPNPADVTATISGTSPNYTLTVSGTGAMKDFVSQSDVPWYSISSNITTLVINEGVTTIGDYAFKDCSDLTGDLTIPSGVTSIGDCAFYYCSGLTGALTIPSGVTSIGDNAFAFCSGFTGTLTIGNSVTTIGDNAFAYCSGFTGVLTIPDGVTSIGDYAFYYCSGLTGALTIGSGVTTIGDYAFQYCSGFTSITCKTFAPPVPTIGGTYTFMGILHSTPVYVVCGMQPYFESSDWATYFNNFQGIAPVVTVQSNDETMGSAAVAQQNTCENNEAIIQATANSGYCFSQWNDGSTANPRTVEVISDTTFTAEFTALPIVTVISNNDLYGSVSITQMNTCENSQAVIAATANSGYCFSQWSDGNTANPRTVEVTTDITYIAEFTALPVVTVLSNDETMGSAAVTQQPASCENLQAIIQATASTTGCFSQWSDGNTDNPRTVEVTTDITYTAEFTALPVVTVLSNNNLYGSVSITQMNTCENDEAVIQATANSGYCFSQWSDGSTANPRTVEVTTDITYTAEFTALPVVTVMSNNDLYGSAIITQMNTCENPQAIIAAYPSSTGCFSQWSDGSTDNPRTVEVTTDITYTAEFAALPVVTVLSNNDLYGSAIITQMNTCENSEAVIQATANSGYCFSQWSDGSTANPRTVEVTTDITYTAEFTALPIVTVLSNNNLYGSASITQINTCENSQAVIAAAANSGYCFSQWNDGNTDNPRTVEVTTDITYTADFTALPVVTVQSNDETLGSAAVVQQPASCENLQAIIAAYPSSIGCFSQWSDGNTDNPRTVEVTSDITYTAEFTALPIVTVLSNNNLYGSAIITQINTCENSEAVIAAAANSGYCFSQWSDGSTANPRTVEVTSDITYTAEFTALPVVTVLSNNDLYGSVSITQQNTCENSQAVIQATASDGYHFVKWDDENIDNPRTVEVTSDITFMAIFEHTDGTDNVEIQNLKLYPNPVKNELIIERGKVGVEDYTMINMAGQVVMRGKLQGKTTAINVLSLASGTYFIKTENRIGKFVKE